MWQIAVFISKEKTDGVPHPPKVIVGGKEVIVCMKGSSKDRVCPNKHCKFAHIFSLDKIEKGVSELNTWTLATEGVKWRSQEVTAAAANAKLTVKKEDTGKNDK